MRNIVVIVDKQLNGVKKMTKEEAIKLIKWHYDYEKEKIDTLDETIPEFEIAIECIEKQIPKRAIHLRYEHFVYWNISIDGCPICEEEIHFVDHNEIKWCTHCGQALKCGGEENDKN